jgi:hypothetical protein
MRCAKTTLLRRFVAVIGAALMWQAPGAHARSVDFAQLDYAPDSSSAVLVRVLGDPRAAQPAPVVSATYSRWNDGETGGIGLLKRWDLVSGTHPVVLGTGAGMDAFRSRASGDHERDDSPSARAQIETYGAVPGGFMYAMAQGSTFRSSTFAVLRYEPHGIPLAFEVSHIDTRGYRANTGALSVPLGRSHWSLRGGVVRDENHQHGFFGLSYNGF